LLLAAFGTLEFLFPVCLAANRLLRAPFSQAPGTFNVYVLGESTSAGDPYRPKLSFPGILSYMYGGRLGGGRLEIINLSVPGADLESQYWRLLRELVLRPPRAGLLLVYAGINEPAPVGDGPGFGWWKCAQRSVILSKLLSFHNDGVPDGNFGQYYSPGRYEYRLAKTLRLAKKNGLKAVVSTLTGNFADFPPYTEPRFSGGGEKAAYAGARRSEAAGRWAEAGRSYAALLAKDSGNKTMLHYRLGRCLARTGDYKGAKENFYLAADFGNSRRPTRAQNHAIRRAAAAEGAAVAETARLYENSSPHGVPGYNLFVDPHHPNIPGYLLLAASFSGEISKLYGEAPLRPAPSEKEVKARFGFKDEDSYEVYLSRAHWFCAEAAAAESNTELIRMAEEYLSKAEQVLGRMKANREQALKLYFWRMVAAAVKRDAAGVARWLEAGDFAGRNNRFVRSGNKQLEAWVSGLLKNSGLPEAGYRKLYAAGEAAPDAAGAPRRLTTAEPAAPRPENPTAVKRPETLETRLELCRNPGKMDKNKALQVCQGLVYSAYAGTVPGEKAGIIGSAASFESYKLLLALGRREEAEEILVWTVSNAPPGWAGLPAAENALNMLKNK